MKCLKAVLSVFALLIGHARAHAAGPDAAEILAATRTAYHKLTGHHFAHALEIEEPGANGKAVTIQRLSFVTATAEAQQGTQDKIGPPLNLARCRLELRRDDAATVFVCDDDASLNYDSKKNEFSRGTGFIQHYSSVGGSIFLAFCGFVHSPLVEGAIEDAKVAREEEIAVGSGKRKCYVVEGTMPTETAIGPGESKVPTLQLDWLLTMLSLQEGKAATTMYSPRPLDKVAAKPDRPTRVTLWIDRESHLVCRSRLTAPYYKAVIDGQTDRPRSELVDVTATFTFTVVEPTAPAKEFFRFTPPADTKEVPNIRERASEKK